jgi:long-chain-fatty-acid---luciferin-component ligase
LDTSTKIKHQIEKLNQHLARYIPPPATWTPAEEALFSASDFLRVSVDQARATQLKSIRYAFSRHYNLNSFYRKYCDEKGVTPADVKTYDDLGKIPLIPDATFKQHPSGKGFAYWLTVIFTGDLPKVTIKGANPSFDDVINAFNAAGLIVTHSSGTSGRYTVLPRDVRTLLDFQYSIAKLTVCLADDLSIHHTLSLMPKKSQSGHMTIAYTTAYISELYDDVRNPLDFQISADMTLKAMTAEKQEPAAASAGERMRKTVENTIKWLERYEKTTDTLRLLGPPVLIFELLGELERQGRRFEFGERGMVMTGGGWKVSADPDISSVFRKRVEETLGIPETRCVDLYGMSEMNTMAYTCPEGHYFHIPYTWLKPMVLDKNLAPAGYGERGRFAFLDGLGASYPGFIIGGDEVRMRERCPVCDVPGPVLDPEIKRAKGEELRGCTEVLSRVFAQTLQGSPSGRTGEPHSARTNY